MTRCSAALSLFLLFLMRSFANILASLAHTPTSFFDVRDYNKANDLYSFVFSVLREYSMNTQGHLSSTLRKYIKRARAKKKTTQHEKSQSHETIAKFMDEMARVHSVLRNLSRGKHTHTVDRSVYYVCSQTNRVNWLKRNLIFRNFVS